MMVHRCCDYYISESLLLSAVMESHSLPGGRAIYRRLRYSGERGEVRQADL